MLLTDTRPTRLYQMYQEIHTLKITTIVMKLLIFTAGTLPQKTFYFLQKNSSLVGSELGYNSIMANGYVEKYGISKLSRYPTSTWDQRPPVLGNNRPLSEYKRTNNL